MVKKLEPLGEKEHVIAARKTARKPRAKKTETTRTAYKTPCVSQGVRNMLLGSASYPVLARFLAPVTPAEAYKIGLFTGRMLGIIADKYDPATRTSIPCIVRP